MEIQNLGAMQSGVVASDATRQSRVSSPEAAAQPPAAFVDSPAKAVQPVESAISPDQLKSALDSMNHAVQALSHGSTLEFTVDPDTRINMVKVVDKSTNEVIRQMPTEEALDIAKALDKLQGMMQGMIIRQKA